MTRLSWHIRPARLADLPGLAGLERRAAIRFPEHDLPPALAGQTLDAATLEQGLADGLLWVAETGAGQIVGFALAEAAEDALHLAEMDVDPAFGRQGIGSALLHALVDEAHRRRAPALTLTTFAHLPWNAPFYRRHGFCDVTPAAHSRLAALLEAERLAGLGNRVAMQRVLAESDSPAHG